jgi:uncharacterized protein
VGTVGELHAAAPVPSGVRENTPGSDWDLLVIVPDDADESILDPQVAWRMRKTSGVRADIFVCRESDFVEDRGMVNTILFDVAHEGVVVYER